MKELSFAQKELFHTIDICLESEVGIVGKCLSDIRVGSWDISVFLIYPLTIRAMKIVLGYLTLFNAP